jgi:hypothetical protein
MSSRYKIGEIFHVLSTSNTHYYHGVNYTTTDYRHIHSLGPVVNGLELNEIHDTWNQESDYKLGSQCSSVAIRLLVLPSIDARHLRHGQTAPLPVLPYDTKYLHYYKIHKCKNSEYNKHYLISMSSCTFTAQQCTIANINARQKKLQYFKNNTIRGIYLQT